MLLSKALAKFLLISKLPHMGILQKLPIFNKAILLLSRVKLCDQTSITWARVATFSAYFQLTEKLKQHTCSVLKRVLHKCLLCFISDKQETCRLAKLVMILALLHGSSCKHLLYTGELTKVQCWTMLAFSSEVTKSVGPSNCYEFGVQIHKTNVIEINYIWD